MIDGPTTDAILKMATEMGRVAGIVEQVDQRVGEVRDAVKDLAESNAADHRQTDGRLVKIEQRLGEGEREFSRLDDRLKAVESQPQRARKNGRTAYIVGLFKAYGPYVVGALVALYTWWTTGQTPKGGSAP